MSTIINASTSSGLVQTADTSGTIELQSNGTTQLTVSSTGSYGQLKSATAQASTSGTSITFTDIPSWVKRITVMFSGVSTNGSSVVQIQLGDSGGIETTSYISSASLIGPTTANTSSTAGVACDGSGGSVVVRSGFVVFTLVTGTTWVASGNLLRADTTGYSNVVTGSKTLSDTLTQVRITTVNGTDTFDAGSINILYEG